MLRLMNVTKSFEGSFEPILKGINLEIEKGDFCILIGSNGSGKSTLMRSISGEYPIDKGRIFIEGEDVTKENRTHLVATVAQDTHKGTISEMTLLENMVLSQLRVSKAKLQLYTQYETKVIGQIKELGIGLESYINKPLRYLSGGQRQMIATLMAMSSNPQILLLDEHTSALDPKTQRQLMDYTTHFINDHPITCLMITHRLEDAMKYGNRLIMMHKGAIVMNVRGPEKEALSLDKLLALFHQYEDLTLMSKEEGEKDRVN